MGFERVQTVLQDVLEIAISEGGAVAIIERAGEAAERKPKRLVNT